MAQIDIYKFKVFYLSALISSLPIIVLAGMIPLVKWEEIFWVFQYINYLAVGVGVLLLSTLTKIQRSLAKAIENRLFDKGRHFPTTEMLLLSDHTLSKAYKDKIRDKVERLSSVELLRESEEMESPDEARHRIRDTMVYIRRYARDSKFNKDANIEYGFIKNLTVGLMVTLPFNVFAMVIFYYLDKKLGLYILGAYGVGTIALIVFSKRLIKERANNYAQRLFEDFMVKDS